MDSRPRANRRRSVGVGVQVETQVEAIDQVREMPSIETVLQSVPQDNQNDHDNDNDNDNDDAIDQAVPSKRARKGRPQMLNREALTTPFASTSKLFEPITPITPRTPASNYLDVERTRFFNGHSSSLPITPTTPWSIRSATPEAGLYKASVNTSLTNVVLRARKAAHTASTPPSTSGGGPPEKPWLSDKRRKRSSVVAFWTFTLAALSGVVGAAMLMYMAWATVSRDKYCLVLDEQFTSPTLDRSIWFYEQETGGFDNGEFEYTTDSPNNTFIEDGTLYIVPTLTSERFGDAAIYDGTTINLTATHQCTSLNQSDGAACIVTSNATSGTILPPIQSARITTNFSRTIRYGKVEVRARMPTGDWLWPSIWMLPSTSAYGQWPRSGEIDIIQTKGNQPTKRGSDASNNMHSSLHFGPTWLFDGYGYATKIRKLWRNYYNQGYHTFGLEWTPDRLFTWEKSPVWRNLDVDFRKDGSFWKLGKFPERMGNGTVLSNPWAGLATEAERRSAPFDQHFYLVLNVAAGGTNGFFQDGMGDNKPWSNQALNARKQFWDSRDQWLTTWPKDPRRRGMAIDYVKIWQLCNDSE